MSTIRKRKSYKAFSFIEVMLAVFMVAVGITAALSLISVGIRNSIQSKYQLTAVMLAQEGVELVRNIRDTNGKANPTNPFAGINEGTYNIDYNESTITLIAGGNRVLKINNGMYNHDSGTDTQFFREIRIIGTGNSRDVYSKVVWGGTTVSGIPTESNCNLSAKCAFSKITLNSWR